MKHKRSILIRPLIIFIDLIIINSVIFVISDYQYLNFIFLSYITVSWLFIGYYTKFYNVYRYTHITKLGTLIMSQFFVFSLGYLSYFSIFKEGIVVNNQLIIFLSIISLITFFKFCIFLLLKKYRLKGKNYRNIILFGDVSSSKILENLFHNRNDLGYRFYGFFSDKTFKSKKYL